MPPENIFQQMSKFTSDYTEEMSALSRPQKLDIRNAIILARVGAGDKQADIATEFRLSDRQVRRILDDSYKDAIEWYEEFPKKIRLALFKINTRAVFQEIIQLKLIKNQTKNTKLKFKMGKDIALLQMRYDSMIANGAGVQRLKDEAIELEKIIAELKDSDDNS